MGGLMNYTNKKVIKKVMRELTGYRLMVRFGKMSLTKGIAEGWN